MEIVLDSCRNIVADDLIQITDLYTDTCSVLTSLGGRGLIKYYKGVQSLLEKFVPEYQFKFSRRGLLKTQLLLSRMVKAKFSAMVVYPNLHQVIANFISYDNYRHTDLRSVVGTNNPLEIDVFVANLSLAFEYQGQQHYRNDSIIGNPHIQISRDQLKKDLCRKNGITLITVPYPLLLKYIYN
jgi:hypothetical protein